MYTARPELGTKRLCVKCAVRFYDLGRATPQCPACGAEQPPPRARTAPVPRGPAARWGARPAARTAEPAEAAEAADDDAVPLLDASDPDDEDADADADVVVADDGEDEAE
jgi:uncharacterized protein (TIGR02300 family)